VPLLDLGRQYAAIKDELEAAALRVLRSGQYVLGPDCRALEQELADYTHCRHAVACASGSDALLLALMALGIRPGDEVLLPSFTFFATAGAVARLGAVPVFVDIEAASFGIDPARMAEAITPATKAVIPVHLYGQCAAIEPILTTAAAHDLAVIEDAAQALGAAYEDRPAGSWGDMGCYSFYPTKNLGCAGDGGMVCTRRDDLADKLHILRVHGMRQRYYHEAVGINSRLDTLQAALLRVKLAHLEAWIAARRRAAERYSALLGPLEDQGLLVLPRELAQRRHVWNQYVIRVPGGLRDALRRYLQDRRVATEVYYPVPLHLQACFADLGYRKGSLPETERAAAEVLALPMFAEISEAEQVYVAASIAGFFGLRGQAIPRPKFLDRAAGRVLPQEA
jgi:dTDP-4-amino-4,6-dideoxygalactose transaminase